MPPDVGGLSKPPSIEGEVPLLPILRLPSLLPGLLLGIRSCSPIPARARDQRGKEGTEMGAHARVCVPQYMHACARR